MLVIVARETAWESDTLIRTTHLAPAWPWAGYSSSVWNKGNNSTYLISGGGSQGFNTDRTLRIMLGNKVKIQRKLVIFINNKTQIRDLILVSFESLSTVHSTAQST